MIKFSAPGKIHLLGEHTVVYGKPALLTTVNLRVAVTVKPWTQHATIVEVSGITKELKSVIEPIIKRYLKIKTIPDYFLEISSQIPIGAGLGSSAAISAAYIAALLSFLRVKWDLNLVNNLAYEAEKVFHGNPSGADNSTIVFGGLLWYRKESPDLKIIQQLPFSIPTKLNNFVFINTGAPKETTKQMVEIVRVKREAEGVKFEKIFNEQEQLVKELLAAIKKADEKELIRIIKAGEKNLENLGVVSPLVKPIIRQIESLGGAAKICGAGGKTGPTGILLAYHKDKSKLENLAKSLNLQFFSAALGVDGLKQS